jgi:hypothetical protein
MAMGRPGKGVGHVDGLDAAEHEKARLKAMLSSLSGNVSLHEASASVGLRPARFAELRRRMLQAAVEAIAPGRPGRPPIHDADETTEIVQLERDNARLERELDRTRLLLQLAQEAPGVLRRGRSPGFATRARRRRA